MSGLLHSLHYSFAFGIANSKPDAGIEQRLAKTLQVKVGAHSHSGRVVGSASQANNHLINDGTTLSETRCAMVGKLRQAQKVVEVPCFGATQYIRARIESWLRNRVPWCVKLIDDQSNALTVRMDYEVQFHCRDDSRVMRLSPSRSALSGCEPYGADQRPDGPKTANPCAAISYLQAAPQRRNQPHRECEKRPEYKDRRKSIAVLRGDLAHRFQGNYQKGILP